MKHVNKRSQTQKTRKFNKGTYPLSKSTAFLLPAYGSIQCHLHPAQFSNNSYPFEIQRYGHSRLHYHNGICKVNVHLVEVIPSETLKYSKIGCWRMHVSMIQARCFYLQAEFLPLLNHLHRRWWHSKIWQKHDVILPGWDIVLLSVLVRVFIQFSARLVACHFIPFFQIKLETTENGFHQQYLTIHDS